MAYTVGGVIANWIGNDELDGGQGTVTELQTLDHRHIMADVVGGDECGESQAPDAHAEGKSSAAMHDGQHGGELRLVYGQVGRHLTTQSIVLFEEGLILERGADRDDFQRYLTVGRGHLEAFTQR